MTRAAPRFAICLSAMLCAGPALAQDVGVRTGLHRDFSRIVIDFRDRPEWRIEGAGDKRVLVTGQPELDYDLTDAFRRIDRSRVAALADIGDGRLEITMACDCHLEMEELSNQHLVIDVVDGPGDRPVAAADPPASQPILPVRTGLGPRVGPRRDLFLVPGSLTDAADPSAAAAARRDAVDAARRRIAQQVSRGVAQGVVTARDIAPLEAVEDAASAIEAAPERAPETTPEVAAVDRPGLDAFPNIRVQTGIDRDNPRRAAADPAVCPPARATDVTAWGTPEALETGLGDARRAIVDELDRPSVDATRALARQEIYRTFGTEAAALLRDDADAVILREIAYLMDDPHDAPMLSSMIDCDGGASLWATLATGTPPEDIARRSDVTVTTFAGMPLHLRRHLGPRLVTRLIAAGAGDAAVIVGRATTRDGAANGPATDMMTARLEQAKGNEAGAAPLLNDVAASRSPEAAEALLMLVDSTLERNRAIDAKTERTLEALEFELRNTPLEYEIRQRRIRSLGSMRDFDRAFALLGALPEGEAADALQTELYHRIADQRDDATFLREALPRLDAPIADMRARLKLAERLIGLGMTDPARQALVAEDGVPGRKERLLRAEIAIIEEKPLIATSFLTGLDGPEIEALNARITALDQRLVAPPVVETVTAPEEEAEAVAALPNPAAELLDRNRSILERGRALETQLDALLQ